MDVWILEYNCISDGEVSISLWANEYDALVECLSIIKHKIDIEWDMDNSDMFTYAEEIDLLQDAGKLRDAIRKWNDYQDDHNSDYAQYYQVYFRPVHGLESASNAVVNGPAAPYRASSPGATCRGHCKEYNEYAYADRRDGTYVCRQCSTFQKIFGG